MAHVDSPLVSEVVLWEWPAVPGFASVPQCCQAKDDILYSESFCTRPVGFRTAAAAGT